MGCEENYMPYYFTFLNEGAVKYSELALEREQQNSECQ
jgi:hypothetical protein